MIQYNLTVGIHHSKDLNTFLFNAYTSGNDWLFWNPTRYDGKGDRKELIMKDNVFLLIRAG